MDEIEFRDATPAERAEAERLCALYNAHRSNRGARMQPYPHCEVAVQPGIPARLWHSIVDWGDDGHYRNGGWIAQAEYPPGWEFQEVIGEDDDF